MQPQDYMLTKSTEPIAIRKYFEAVLKLEQTSAEQFPIDLDQVWELAYERKDYAVKALESVFIKDSDYQTFRQKAEAGKHNKTVVNKYYLTVPAMEWFVARRVPAVFEVYREVFHQAANKHILGMHKDHVFLCGMVGSPLTINNVPYWPYSHVMTAAGYKHRPNRLYRMANAVIDKNQLFPFVEESMFVEEYGRIWARAEVFTALQARRQAWLALDEAQRAVRMIMQ